MAEIALDQLLSQSAPVQTQSSEIALDDLIMKSTPPQQEGFNIMKPFSKRKGSELKGGLNVFQRMKLSFGETKGRKDYLERLGFTDVNLTPEGNFVMKNPKDNSWVVTDPTGFDLGDIGDIAGGMLPMGGWMAGAAAGGTVTSPTVAGVPMGVVAGGGAGAATGEIWRQNVGQLLGVHKGTAAEKIGDVALEGLVSAGGEFGMQAAKPFVKGVGRQIAKGAGNIWKKAGQPFVENMFNFTSNISKEAIDYAIKNNPLKVITRKNWSKEIPFNMTQTIREGAKVTHAALRKQWQNIVEPIKNSAKNVINLEALSGQIDDVFRSFGLLTDEGDLAKPILKGSQRQRYLEKLYKSVKGMVQKESTILDEKGKPLTTQVKDITVKAAMGLREEIDAIINRGFKEGIFTSKDVAQLKAIRKIINNEIHTKFPAIAAVDSAYSSFHDAFDLIDIDWNSPKQIATLENLLSRYPNLQVAMQNAFQTINKMVPEKYKFIDKVLASAYAKEFQPTVLRAIRTNLIQTLLGPGVGYAVAGPAGAAIGITVSTPRGVGAVLKAGAKAVGAAKATGGAVKKVAPTTFRGLIQQELEEERNK